MAERKGLFIKEVGYVCEKCLQKRHRSEEPRTSVKRRVAKPPKGKRVPDTQLELPGPRMPRNQSPSTSETAVMRNNYFS